MLFKPYSHFLSSILPKFESKSQLATKIGIERRKLDSLLADPYGLVTYDEGKSVEHFSRAYHAAQETPEPDCLRFVISGSFHKPHSDLKDHFAVSFWPEQQLMIAKATSGHMDGILSDRDTEKRAIFAVQTLENARIPFDLSKVSYFEIQRLRDLYYPRQVLGLTNTMASRTVEYQDVLSPDTAMEILRLANHF